MGERVERSALKVGHSGDVRRRLEDSVTALAAMLNQGCFAHHEDSVGTELELDLVDPLGLPRLVNDDVLARLARPDLQQELGRFNIEFNLRPRRLTSGVLYAMESEFAATLRTRGLEDLGVRLVAVGTLPTAGPEELMRDRLSSPSRYELLARRMRAERHGPVAVRIDGVESLTFVSPSVAPEAAATSLQLHLRVPPDRFASYYNAAQAIAGAQLAAGANSPYLLGRQLWQETRHPAVRADARHQAGSKDPGRCAAARLARRPMDPWAGGVVRLDRPVSASTAAYARSREPVRRPDVRESAPASGTAAPQRHRVALEPAGVRRAGRAASPPDREPGAAQRPRRARHDRERRVLSGAGPCAVGCRPSTVVHHAVRAGRNATSTRRPGWGWMPPCIGTAQGFRPPSSSSMSCYRWLRPASTPGASHQPSATATCRSSHSGSVPARPAPAGRPPRCRLD